MGSLIFKNNLLGSDEAVKKAEENYIYIEEHVKNVQKAFEMLFDSKRNSLSLPGYDNRVTNIILDKVKECTQFHDESKYSDEEFYAYRKNFFPTNEEIKLNEDPDVRKQVEDEFEEAWKHHYMTNDHHPKFWRYNSINERDEFGSPLSWKVNLDLEQPEKMGIVSICHMICDWEAMSIKFGGTTIDWYINKAKDERAVMNPETRDLVEEVLEMIYSTKLPSKEEIDRKDKENINDKHK